MNAFAFSWVDAFASRRFAGNPCAVFFDADAIDEAARIRITAETRLSECAFVQRADAADFAARYYTASGEIKMAGHPTVATVAALIDRGAVAPPARFALEVGAGVIEIDVAADGEIVMTQLRPSFGRRYQPAEIAPLFGLAPENFLAPPQTVSTGTPFLIAPLRSHDALRRADLQVAALLAMRDRPDVDFADAFLTTLEGAESGDTFSRLLLAPPEPPEDPFTGSATGCMAAYLWANGLIDRPGFVAEQGHWMGRPGQAHVHVLGPPDDISGIKVGGHGVVLMRGELLL